MHMAVVRILMSLGIVLILIGATQLSFDEFSV